MIVINPFLVNIHIIYPLKTPKNLWFSGVFRRYKMRALTRNKLKVLVQGIFVSVISVYASESDSDVSHNHHFEDGFSVLRYSHQSYSIKKGFLNYFAKFTGK